MSRAASRGRGARAAPASKLATQKRKRQEEEEEVEDDDDDDSIDLDALIAEQAEDDEQDDVEADGDEEDDEELDIDPQEIAAMEELRRKRGIAASAAMEDDEDEGGDSSSDDGAEYADDGTGSIARPASKRSKVTFLNNRAALEDKLADFRLPQSWPWIETLALNTHQTFAQATGEDPNAVHDDLKREAAFYELSLSSATEGLARLADLEIPFRIPPDYFAERVKPDRHMDRIKDKLLEEKAKMAAVAERKAQKEAKKYAKQVQTAQIQAKAAEKKAATAEAGKMRKANNAGEKELPLERSILPGMKEHLEATRAESEAKKQKRNFKREAKDKKYGFGGKKRRIKSNNAESTFNAATKDYNLNKMRKPFEGFRDAKPGSFSDRRSGSNKGGHTNRNGSSFTMGRAGSGKGKGKGKPNRPGKATRAKSRK